MQLDKISTKLIKNQDGIYVASGSAAISYSLDGHAVSFGVEDSSFWFRHRNDCIVSVIENHPFQGPLLDIGGGNGYVAQRLAREGWEVVLLEPGEEGARNAKLRRNLDNVACATLEDAAFHPSSFGAVGMFNVIEHIEADRDFLQDLLPLLTPSGKLYMTVPCHSWLWSQADVRAGHFRRHTRATLHSLLDGIFKVDYLGFYFRPLVVPQFLLRALPYRMGLVRDRGLLSVSTEHGSRRGLMVRAIEAMLGSEARAIAQNRTLGFGASALVAATRI